MSGGRGPSFSGGGPAVSGGASGRGAASASGGNFTRQFSGGNRGGANLGAGGGANISRGPNGAGNTVRGGGSVNGGSNFANRYGNGNRGTGANLGGNVGANVNGRPGGPGVGANAGAGGNVGRGGLNGSVARGNLNTNGSFARRHSYTANKPIVGGPGNVNVGAGGNVAGPGRGPGYTYNRGPGFNGGFNGGVNGGINRGGLNTGVNAGVRGPGGYASGYRYPGWNYSQGGRNRSVAVFSPFIGGFGFPFIGLNNYGYNRYGYGYGNRYGYGGFGLGYGYPFYGFGYRSIFPFAGFGLGYGGLGYGGLGYGNYGYGNGGYGYSRGGSSPTVVVQQPVAQPATTASVQFAAQGEAEFKAGNYKAAIQSWRHALVDDPQNGVLVLMLAQAFFADGQFNDAAGAVQQGLAMLPEDQWNVVVANYNELYGRSSDYATQLKALEAAAKAEPENPANLFSLGYHYGFLGYKEQAVKKLDQLIKLAPEDELAKRLRGVLLGEAPPAAESIPVPAEPPRN